MLTFPARRFEGAVAGIGGLPLSSPAIQSHFAPLCQFRSVPTAKKTHSKKNCVVA